MPGVEGVIGVSEELVGPVRMALLFPIVAPLKEMIIGGKSDRVIVFAIVYESTENIIAVIFRKEAILLAILDQFLLNFKSISSFCPPKPIVTQINIIHVI